jgi:phage portal protein BeeE
MSDFRTRLKRAGQAVIGLFQANSSTRAFGLLGGVYGVGGLPPARTAEGFLQAYSTSPWLRAVAGKVSQACSAVVWEAGYRQQVVEDELGKRWRAVSDRVLKAGSHDMRQARRKDLETQFQHIPDHPILALLDSGNPFLSGQAVRQVTQLHLDILGEAFWLLERNGQGVPLSIWPLPPTWVLETPDLKRSSYRVSFRGWQGQIPETEVVWFRHADPANPYGRGTGIVQALGDEIETDEYASKTIKTRFYSGARPDFVMSPKLREGEEPVGAGEVAVLKERWLSEHEGFQRASRPFFSSLPVEVNVLSQTFQELQLVQLREHQRNTIIQCFGGIPPELLGIIDQSNRATIDAASYLFQQYVISPRIEFLRSVLQQRLVPLYDARLVLDYESPVQEDREHHLKVMQAQPAVVRVDEWREEAGLPELEDGMGQGFVVPLGVEVRPTLDWAGETLIQPGPPVVPDPNAVPTPAQVGVR